MRENKNTIFVKNKTSAILTRKKKTLDYSIFTINANKFMDWSRGDDNLLVLCCGVVFVILFKQFAIAPVVIKTLGLLITSHEVRAVEIEPMIITPLNVM